MTVMTLHLPAAPWREKGKADEPKKKYACVLAPLFGEPRDRILALAAMVADADLADDGREDDPHVTVRYGLHTDDADEVARVIGGSGPIPLRLGAVSLFTSNPEYDVLKLDIDSPTLHELHWRLGVLPHTDTHPIYFPHATIAYVKAGKGTGYVERMAVLDVTAYVDSVVFSDAAKRKSTISLTGPVVSRAGFKGASVPRGPWREKAWDESAHPRGQPENAGQFAPHKMTRESHRAAHPGVKAAAERLERAHATGQRKPRESAEAWRDTQHRRADDEHRAAVVAALKAGEDVSAEVLAEYPDLAEKYKGFLPRGPWLRQKGGNDKPTDDTPDFTDHPFTIIGDAVLVALGVPPAAREKGAKDAAGHEHKGTGPGGGQFTGSDGGSATADRPAKGKDKGGKPDPAKLRAALRTPAVRQAARKLAGQAVQLAHGVHAAMLAQHLTPAALVGDQSSWETWFCSQYADPVAHHLGVDYVTASHILTKLAAFAITKATAQMIEVRNHWRRRTKALLPMGPWVRLKTIHDAAGHDHRESGPGGGQFVGDGDSSGGKAGKPAKAAAKPRVGKAKAQSGPAAPPGGKREFADPAKGLYLDADANGHPVTPLNPDEGQRRATVTALAPAIAAAWKMLPLYSMNSGGLMTMGLVIKEVLNNAPPGTSANDVQNAMYQLGKDGRVELHELNEVHSLTHPESKAEVLWVPGKGGSNAYAFVMTRGRPSNQPPDLSAYSQKGMLPRGPWMREKRLRPRLQTA